MASKNYFAMLPKLDDDNTAILLDQSGVWRSAGEDLLPKLVASLAKGTTLGDAGSIDSIPDVWAKPLLFKMALFDIESAREFVAGLHERVVGEWRALLAMLALKDVRHLDLKTIHVPLEGDNTEMAEVFRLLAPTESVDGNKKAWLTDIYVIFYKDLPIAMTSPITLVASAADYSLTFRGMLDLPWSNDRTFLTDPIKNLSKSELNDLHGWLVNLHAKLRDESKALPVTDADTAQSLLKCIKDYQNDVKKEMGASMADVNFVASNLDFHLGISRLLNETVKGRAADIRESAVMLRTNPSRANQKLILVSPSMLKTFAQQEGIDTARLVVWAGISANDVKEDSLQYDKGKIGKILLNGTQYRRPEDFFYDKMTVIPQKNAFSGAVEISGETVFSDEGVEGLTPILPIKRELAELFSPQEIIERLSFSADADNFMLHFNFPLSGVDGGGADYRFTKVYSKRELEYNEDDVPVIEIWPNIRLENWKKYYLYYENYRAQIKGEENSAIENMYYVEPYSFGKSPRDDYPAQGMKNRLTARLDGFPELLIFNYKPAGFSAAAQEIGMIFLSKPQTVSHAGGFRRKIGVDFGTSSTMLYFSEDGQPPQPLTLEPRLFQITNSGNARTNTFRSFIDYDIPIQLDGSFLSVFHLLNADKARQDIRPLQDGHVITSEMDPGKLELLRPFFDTNLKWQNDSFGRRKVAAYVRQICMQALVEAAAIGVNELQWNFSYPTAFSQEQKLAFEATCREGIKNAYEDTGFDIDSNDDIEIWSESKSSAYYFNKLDTEGVNFINGAMCIDIGAGTTDISIISGQPARIIYHSSVQYAGRYIFKPINDQFSLFDEEKAAEILKYRGDEKNLLIDTYMRLNSKKYIEDLAYKTGQEPVKTVLQGVQFTTAGLFYYLGKILGLLRQSGLYKEKNLPDVYFGGNGSRIFSWITGGLDTANNPYLKVFAKMLEAGSGLKSGKKFKLHVNKDHKVEVVCGMIAQRPANDQEFFDEERIIQDLFLKESGDEFVQNSVVAGAEFLENGNPMPASAFINANNMNEGINVDSLDEFEKFIAAFNKSPKLWADGVPFDEDAANELISKTNSFFVGWKGYEKKKIFVEPVFIIELKRFVEMLKYGG